MMDLRTKRALIDYLAGYVTPARIEKMRRVLDRRTRHLCIVMEDIYQSHNASAVLRSCDCFGIQDVHIIENKNRYQVNPDVALGASKWLSIHKYNQQSHNTADCLKQLKQKGYRIVATSPHKDDCLLEDLAIDQKTALLFGTELKGLTTSALEMADAFMKIPMTGFTESLNISVSAAICLYHLAPRIRSSQVNWQLSEAEQAEILLEWIKTSLKNPQAMIDRFARENKAAH